MMVAGCNCPVESHTSDALDEIGDESAVQKCYTVMRPPRPTTTDYYIRDGGRSIDRQRFALTLCDYTLAHTRSLTRFLTQTDDFEVARDSTRPLCRNFPRR